MKRRIAIALLHVAAKILPAARREWLRDMRGEIEYVKSDAVALEWATGCVFASIQERMRTMLNSNGMISRPVLVLEWLMCFGPLTMAAIAGARFIFNYGPAPDIVIGTTYGILGVIALGVALHATLWRAQRSFAGLLKMIAGAFALLLVLQLANAGAADKLNSDWFKFEWPNVLMFAILPLAAVLHLLSMSHSTMPERA